MVILYPVVSEHNMQNINMPFIHGRFSQQKHAHQRGRQQRSQVAGPKERRTVSFIVLIAILVGIRRAQVQVPGKGSIRTIIVIGKTQVAIGN